MIIPRPSDQLAGCCWLPRFAAKVRLAQAKQLPFVYRLALASSLGIDGAFLRRFRLSPNAFFQAVQQSPDDEALARWFRAQPSVTDASIAGWNRFAPRLGQKGHSGYHTFQLIKWLLYPKAVTHPVQSLFQAIEQDEQM
jgi:hypothetical protein